MGNNFFNIIAPVYDFLAVGLDNTVQRLTEIGQFSPNDIVLDMGGGTGRVAARLKPQVKEIIVADISEKMLRQCEKKGLRCVAVSGNIIPFPDHYFDKIIMVDALHHVQDMPKVMQEMKRVLKPGGSLIIEEFNPRRLGGRWIMLFEKLLMLGSVFYEPERLAALLQKEGFATTLYTSNNKEYYVVAANMY